MLMTTVMTSTAPSGARMVMILTIATVALFLKANQLPNGLNAMVAAAAVVAALPDSKIKLGVMIMWLNHSSLKLEVDRQTRFFPASNVWKLGEGAQVLAVAATGGYLCFIPFATSPDLATFLLICLGLFAVNQAKPLRPNLRHWDYLVITALLFSVLLSALLSRDVVRGLDYIVYLSINLLLLLTASALQGRREVKVVALCLGLFGLTHLAALMTASQSLDVSDASQLIYQAGLTTLVVPNDALILGLCFPSLTFALMSKDRRWTDRAFVLMGIYAGLTAYACYLLQSKVALLSLLTAVFAMAASRFLLPQRSALKPVFTIGLLVTGILLAGGLAWYFGNQSTIRLSLWIEAATAHSTISEILFGAGPNSFVFDPSAAGPLFDNGDLIIPWVHNLYLEVWHDQGLLGLLAFCALTILPIQRALRIEDRGIQTLILASMATFILAAFFEVTLTRRFYFAYLAFFYGLAASQSKERENEKRN